MSLTMTQTHARTRTSRYTQRQTERETLSHSCTDTKAGGEGSVSKRERPADTPTRSVLTLSLSQLETIKHTVKQKHIPLADLKMVCERLEICNVLSHHPPSTDHTHKNRKIVNGNKYKTKGEIGYIETHYFLIKQTEYTSYCIENYEEVKELSLTHTLSHAHTHTHPSGAC